jgi:hypothetical protein
LFAGLWQLRGIGEIDRGRCPLYLDQEDIKDKLLRYSGTRNSRKNILNKNS